MLGKAYVPYLLALEGREVSGQWIQRGSVQAVGVFDALIPQGEPITFCEEAFVSHRSSVMRQFLQNAIQLQLFKQVLPP